MPTKFVRTENIRWHHPSSKTTTFPPILQQMWQCTETGIIEWRDVPLVIGDN